MIATAIDDVWATRAGHRQEIAIDLRHAALALSSMWLLQVDGERAVERFPLTPPATFGQHVTADGRTMDLTDVTSTLEAGALEVLGCEPSAEAVAAAIAARTASELEQAFVERDLTGVIVRTPEEWLSHPAGAALVETPVVEIEQIGDAPPTPLPPGPRPLSGLRVLEDTRVLAGPTIALSLGAFGADVLQVGAQRHVEDDQVAAVIDTGHGKRRAFLDLASPSGRDRMRELLRSADVFSQSYRTGSLERMGFGPDAVAAIRPGIIYVSTNCYGFSGPWVSKRGFDGQAKAASGILALTSVAKPDLTSVAMAMNDYCTGYWGAYGVIRALQLRAERGGSYHVRVSLGQTAMWLLRLGVPHDPEDGMPGDQMTELAGEFMERARSPYGVVERLRPAIQMSETGPSWARPMVSPGTHEALWEQAAR